jgi:hypothetical protein
LVGLSLQDDRREVRDAAGLPHRPRLPRVPQRTLVRTHTRTHARAHARPHRER